MIKKNYENLNSNLYRAIISRSEDLSRISLLMEGYGVTSIAATGIFFIIVGLFELLQKKNRKHFFNLLLLAQLCFDLFLNAMYLIKSVLTHFVALPMEHFRFNDLFVCPALRFSLVCSIFMTVALTYSRARAVEKPLQQRSLGESRTDRIKHLAKYVVPVILASIALTIPWFFEYKISIGTTTSSGTPLLLASDIRQSPLYAIGVIGVFSLLILGIIPNIALIVFSCKIYNAVQRSSPIRGTATSYSQTFNKKSPKWTIVLAIAMLSLVSSIPRITLTSLEITIQFLTLFKSDFLKAVMCYIPYCSTILNNTNKLVTVLNSSMHIFLYKGISTCKSSKSLRNSQRNQSYV